MVEKPQWPRYRIGKPGYGVGQSGYMTRFHPWCARRNPTSLPARHRAIEYSLRSRGRLLQISTVAMFTGLLICAAAWATGDAPAGRASEPVAADKGPTSGESAVPTIKPSGTEQELAAKLEATLVAGEVVWLDSKQGKFFAICQRKADLPAKGAFLIVPRIGRFLGEDGLVRVLREYLPTGGWVTLAIQPPLVAASANADDHDAAVPATRSRVEEGIRYLRSLDIDNIVVVGVGRGAAAALELLSTVDGPGVTGFAGIGDWPGGAIEMPFPILDIAGSRDRRASELARRRASWFEMKADRRYELLVVAGAGRRFVGSEMMVAKRIRGWAERITAGGTISVFKQPVK